MALAHSKHWTDFHVLPGKLTSKPVKINGWFRMVQMHCLLKGCLFWTGRHLFVLRGVWSLEWFNPFQRKISSGILGRVFVPGCHEIQQKQCFFLFLLFLRSHFLQKMMCVCVCVFFLKIFRPFFWCLALQSIHCRKNIRLALCKKQRLVEVFQHLFLSNHPLLGIRSTWCHGRGEGDVTASKTPSWRFGTSNRPGSPWDRTNWWMFHD